MTLIPQILTPGNLKLDKFSLTTDAFGTVSSSSFRLISGTFLGTWTLKAAAPDLPGVASEIEFIVEEFVLPKFEVVVTPALNFIAKTDIPTSIPVTVEAT